MNIRYPRLLSPGGTIGICSPAGPSPSAAMERAEAALQARGYNVVIAPHAVAEDPELSYLGGTDAERLAELNGLLRDPAIDLILCARGGYGCMRILEGIDYDAARADPKPLVGYSDITALSLALAARAEVVSFSGIMATAGSGLGQDSLDPYSEESFFQAVGAGAFPRTFSRPPSDAPWEILRGPQALVGPVVPVCLTLLTSLVGTPYVPNLAGAILLIEDVHEELYAIDRYLAQLRLAGIFDNIAGLLLGSFTGVSPEEDARLRVAVPRLAADLVPAHVALASGVAYGHIPRRLTLPVGAIGTVDLGACTFQFDGPI